MVFCISNLDIIISKRAKDKFPCPDTWTCAVGGKAKINEDIEQAALREMQEEANLQTPLKYVTSLKYKDDIHDAKFHIFTTKEAISISHLKPNPKEIQYFKELTIKEIEDIIKYAPKTCAPSFIAVFNAFKEKF